jgi:hypothetical protein
MLQELLQPRPDVERRAVGRRTINRDVLMYFSGQDGVHARCVRDGRFPSHEAPDLVVRNYAG